MLKQLGSSIVVGDNKLLRFSEISSYQRGKGLCLVYNARVKKTRNGKPFVTLYLRDVDGTVIPGYIFDLSSALMAGEEAAKVVGKIVHIEFQENYLSNIGMTVILDNVAMATGVPPEVFAAFSGKVEDIQQKEAWLKKFFLENLKINIQLPVHIATYASPDYMQGRVGGLLEYYYRMAQVLQMSRFLPEEMGSNLFATFAIYICAHSAYVRANDDGEADITLVTTLTSLVSRLDNALKLGPAAMEVVHMFFGYEPMDVYVRNIMAVAELVQRMDREFSVYKTVPVQQEGDAGYGRIKRYKVETKQ